ncbi:MAG: imidazole glycerol phosphate synthase subunit HisH [Proteobacteria bacterium]|nr:imidazole glycerol phosphate synthase subunit HisH [Pseudomonadota bacterium]
MIAILDYDAGNLTSVERAVRHLGFPCAVTSELSAIAAADRIIFPGVGAAGSAMESLKRRGLDKALALAVDQGKPVLGICLGTQIILTQSEENHTRCLGLVSGRVFAFPPDMKEDGERLKVPHMGWNNVEILADHPVLADIRPEHQFYFVHSYYPQPENEAEILGRTRYGLSFPSVIGRKNLVATQFHPEKSGPPGLALLRNFCLWNP